MKIFNKFLFCLIASTMIFTSCVDEDSVNQARPGPVGEPRLDINAVDVSGTPVSGATVTIFTTAEDYANETNPIATATTDAEGVASFLPADLNDDGVYYINIASGTLRNWTSTTSTPYLYLETGPTVINSTLSSVPQSFIDLVSTDWQMVSYEYPGDGNILGFAPACENDDIFRFRKDGVVIRFEGATSCSTPTEDQAPVSADGEVWSAWSLDGGTITIRDLDPFFEAGLVEAGLTTTATTATIDYGAGYIAIFNAI